jgi:hypothetical protein
LSKVGDRSIAVVAIDSSPAQRSCGRAQSKREAVCVENDASRTSAISLRSIGCRVG